MIRIPPATPVLVLETESFAEKDPRADCAIVRVLDGPLKGAKLWVAEFYVTRLIDNPTYARTAIHAQKDSPAGSSPASSPATSETPSSLWRQGQQFEMAGSGIDALATYNALLRKFPDSPEAGEAAERIRAVEQRREDDATNEKAARELILAQNLEKSRKVAAAFAYYRRIVKEYPRSPAAKTAGERIKAFGGK